MMLRELSVIGRLVCESFLTGFCSLEKSAGIHIKMRLLKGVLLCFLQQEWTTASELILERG